MVTHLEIFPQLLSWEFQHVLKEKQNSAGAGEEARSVLVRLQQPHEAAPWVLCYLQVLVFGHDSDLVAIDAEDLALQVDQFTLTHLHVVTGLEIMLTLLPWG